CALPIYLQGLPCFLLAFGLRQVAQGTHVVQAVAELDDEDPDVAGHRHDHLAHGLGLRGLAVLDLVEFGDAVDEFGDLVAEVGAQLVEGVAGVLDGVVQQARGDGGLLHAEFGEDGGHREGMGDVGVAALASLVPVVVGGDLVGAFDEPDVRLGVGGADGLDEWFEDRVHGRSPLSAESGEPASDPYRGRRSGMGGYGTRGVAVGLGCAGGGRGGAFLRGGSVLTAFVSVPPVLWERPCRRLGRGGGRLGANRFGVGRYRFTTHWAP